jgi:hypothetical protein
VESITANQVTTNLITANQLLGGLAAALLVFVSGGVIYLSVVEWRDRRRRARAEMSSRGSGRS